MEENGCCFDNYYNKKKVKLQLIEDNRLNKHPESHGFFIPTYKLCVIFQLSAIANSYFMIWPAIWVNAQAGVMGGKYQKLFWSIKEKYDLTSAVWSEFEVVSEFLKKNMYVFHESENFLPTEKPLTIMMLLGLYSRF